MKFYLFALTVISTLLASCGTVVPQSSVTAFKGQLPADSGVVVAESLTNSARVTGPIEVWNELVIWRQDISKEEAELQKIPRTYSLDALKLGRDEQQYMGILPEGTYRLGYLWAFVSDTNFSYSAKAYIPPSIGEFEIIAGEATNLGTVLFHSFEAKGRSSEYIPSYAITRIKNDDLWNRMAPLYPHIASQVNNEKINTWTKDDFAQPRLSTLNLIQKEGVLNRIHRLSSGLYLTGKLGTIIDLQSGKRFQNGLQTINDLIELDDGELIAAADYGQLYSLTDGNFVKIESSFSSNENITHIENFGNREIAFITRSTKKVRLYVTSLDNIENVEPLKVYVDNTSAFSYWSPSPQLIKTPNGVSFFVGKERLDYDAATKMTMTSKTKKHHSLFRNENGDLVSSPASLNNTGWGKIYKSSDDGISWESKTNNAVSGFIHMFENEHLIKMGSGTKYNFWTGERTGRTQVNVRVSKNRGAEWSTVTTLPEGCYHISQEASRDDEVLVICEYGEVLMSADKGLTWTVINKISHDTFKLYPKELKVKIAN